MNQKSRFAIDNKITVKHVYNDHPWDPKMLTIVDRRLLFRFRLCNKNSKWGLKMTSIQTGGSYSEVSLAQVRLFIKNKDFFLKQHNSSRKVKKEK